MYLNYRRHSGRRDPCLCPCVYSSLHASSASVQLYSCTDVELYSCAGVARRGPLPGVVLETECRSVAPPTLQCRVTPGCPIGYASSFCSGDGFTSPEVTLKISPRRLLLVTVLVMLGPGSWFSVLLHFTRPLDIGIELGNYCSLDRPEQGELILF